MKNTTAVTLVATYWDSDGNRASSAPLPLEEARKALLLVLRGVVLGRNPHDHDMRVRARDMIQEATKPMKITVGRYVFALEESDGTETTWATSTNMMAHRFNTTTGKTCSTLVRPGLGGAFAPRTRNFYSAGELCARCANAERAAHKEG